MFYYSEDFVKELITPLMTDDNSAEIVEKLDKNKIDAEVDVQSKIDAAIADSNKSWNARFRKQFLEGGTSQNTTPSTDTGNANTAVADMAGNVASATVSAVDSIKNLFKTVPVDEYNKK